MKALFALTTLAAASTLITGCVKEMGPGTATLTTSRDLKFKTILDSPVELRAGESRQAEFKVDANISEIQMWIDGKKIVFGWAKDDGMDAVISNANDTSQDLNGYKLGARASRKYLSSNFNEYESTDSCTYTVSHQEYRCSGRPFGSDTLGSRTDHFDVNDHGGRPAPGDHGGPGRPGPGDWDRDHDRCGYETVYETRYGHQRVRNSVHTTNYSFHVDIFDDSRNNAAQADGTYAETVNNQTALSPCI